MLRQLATTEQLTTNENLTPIPVYFGIAITEQFTTNDQLTTIFSQLVQLAVRSLSGEGYYLV